jgi:chemotaxis protein methyltransferase CheR
MNKDLGIMNNFKNNQMLEIKNYENLYLKIILDRLGIVIGVHQKNELYKIIQEACDKFKCTPEEYARSIAVAADESPMLEHLVTGITVGETYFFRDKNQMELLMTYVLPNIIKNKINNKNIRIWSAGCATGEEIYTIAMILAELIPDIEEWTIKLLASDINVISLQRAMAGNYSEWSMRSISEYYKKKYFTQVKNHYHLSKKISEMVDFEFLNLNDNGYPSIFNGTNSQDLILCRNVLIYFDINRINPVMHKLQKSLVPGGYLMLGASDPINLEGTHLQFEKNKGLLFTYSEASRVSKETEVMTLPKSMMSESVPIKKYSFNNIHEKEKHISKVSINMLNDYFRQSKWNEILMGIENLDHDESNTSHVLNLKALAQANLGYLEEAIKTCDLVLKSDSTNKFTHFTCALSHLELNHISEAETALRKTLFLDNQFVAGHYQLGLLLIKIKQFDAGLRALKNALKIAESMHQDHLVPGSNGIDYSHLSEILRKEISLYM